MPDARLRYQMPDARLRYQILDARLGEAWNRNNNLKYFNLYSKALYNII
jgi:hypothetical protein